MVTRIIFLLAINRKKNKDENVHWMRQRKLQREERERRKEREGKVEGEI